MTKLSVNINKVATLRNTRAIGIPSPVAFARIALEAGAAGITVHPRPDERHIRPHDVDDVAALMRDFPEAELNIEGNPAHGLIEYAERIRPAQCTLVPDATDAFTSSHGWDVDADEDLLRQAIERIHAVGCRVSLFMDPDPTRVADPARLGADRVELYTEPYAAGFAAGEKEHWLGVYAECARRCADSGLGVNAGHDLNLDNLGPFLERVIPVHEVSIGHALVADALEHGMARTVGLYLDVIRQSSRRPF